jgi:hypothetical protein
MVYINFDQMSTPDQATLRVEGEFKSPVVYVEKVFYNGKAAGTHTYNLLK